MTLTQMIPSLRRTLPDPLWHDRWPEHSVASTTDVTVAGVSLVRLVDLCQTPCVHVASASAAGSRGERASTDQASVVITRIESVSLTDDDELMITIDADLSSCSPIVTEARLIGRWSTAHVTRVHVVPDAASSAAPDHVSPLLFTLPDDLRAGDLIALPCPGGVCLHDVRR